MSVTGGGVSMTTNNSFGSMMNARSCPYINTPIHECYFQKTDSRSIESAMMFCLYDYTRCMIFESLFFCGASSNEHSRESMKQIIAEEG